MVEVLKVSFLKKSSPNGRGRVYILREGEPVAPDRAFIREARSAVEKVLDGNGLSGRRVVGWRRTAGCRCGCSPGFIADIPFDVCITVNG